MSVLSIWIKSNIHFMLALHCSQIYSCYFVTMRFLGKQTKYEASIQRNIKKGVVQKKLILCR